MFYRGDVPAPECPCSAQVRDLFVWLCPAKKLIARVVFCVEQRDLRLLVCVCVFLCQLWSRMGSGAGEWHY